MGANASAELAGISRRLAEVGDRKLKLATAAAIRGVVKSAVLPALSASADAKLPHTGGLNQHVASQDIQVRTTMTGRSSAVRLRQPYVDARQTDNGYVRHPVYGNRGAWVSQEIPGATGWWTNTLKAAEPEVTAALLTVIRATSAALER